MFYLNGTNQEEIDKITFEDNIQAMGLERRARPFLGYGDSTKEYTYML